MSCCVWFALPLSHEGPWLPIHDVASTAQATDLFFASRSTHINIYQHHVNSPLLPSHSHKSQSNFLPLPHFLYTHHALSPPLVFRGPSALPLPSPDDQSLTSILETPQQRSDFTLLIASATASMCKPSRSLHSRPRRRQRAPPSQRRRPSRAPKPQRYRHPRRRQSAPRPGRPPQSHRSQARAPGNAGPTVCSPGLLRRLARHRAPARRRSPELLSRLTAAAPRASHIPGPRPRGARVLPPRAQDQSVGAAL